MKKYLSIIFMLVLSAAAFGQIEATTNDGKKVILNADKTWNYAPASNDAQKIIFAPLKDADIEDVALFPNKYDSATLRLKNVWIGSMEQLKDGNMVFYSMRVESHEGKFFPSGISTVNQISFVFNEAVAEPLAVFYKANRRDEYTKIGANLIVQTKAESFDNQSYFLARVLCVEILNFKNVITKKIGDCN